MSFCLRLTTAAILKAMEEAKREGKVLDEESEVIQEWFDECAKKLIIFDSVKTELTKDLFVSGSAWLRFEYNGAVIIHERVDPTKVSFQLSERKS